jgi:hypothetical protein
MRRRASWEGQGEPFGEPQRCRPGVGVGIGVDGDRHETAGGTPGPHEWDKLQAACFGGYLFSAS